MINYNLEDKKILITGSSGGIGLSLSKRFVELGCKIIFTSSNKVNLDKLKNLFGEDHAYYLLNLLEHEIFLMI